MRSSPRAAAASFACAAAAAWGQAADVSLCTACHGPDGNSVIPTTPSIAGQPRVFLENQLVLIREGLREVPPMAPVMRGLSDEQIVALAKHYAVVPARPVTAGAAKPDLQRRGAEVSQRALCGTCHLPDYRGQNQVPRLAGQQETYLLTTLKMYRDAPAPGRDTAMSAVLYGLKDADLEALAHYMARRTE
jgi:cytochrome c553